MSAQAQYDIRSARVKTSYAKEQLSCLANAAEQLAAYPACQAGLKLVEQLLIGASWVPLSLPLPAPAAATVSSRMSQLARSARATRRAGMRREAEGDARQGVVLSGVNWLLDMANLRVRSITKKKVSFKTREEMFRRDSTSSCSSSDDCLNCVEELNNSVLDAYISDEDPDFVPTSAEIAQAEADEEKAALEIEESIASDKILEDLNRDLVVADELSEAKLAEYLSEEDPDYQPTQVERELAEEHSQLQNSSCDDEPSTGMHRNLVEHSYSRANLEVVAKDMFTEMGVSDCLAGDMFNKRGVSGNVYTCPLVMSDSCNIDPIGLPDMMSGTAIRHLTESHGIPQTECTRNEFRFTCWQAVCSDIQGTRAISEGEGVHLMDNNVENDVGENEAGTDLLDISQDPAVLACGNVVPGEEVEYLSGHCLPRLLPPSAPPMIGGVQVTADIKQEMNLVEVVYEAGFCLPRLIVKEEAQEDFAEKELHHSSPTLFTKTGNISASSMNAEEVLSVSTQDLTMMMAAMKAKQGILNMTDIVDTMVEEQGEVSTKELVDEGAELGASLPVEVGSAVNCCRGAEFEEGLEFGASVPEGDLKKFMGVVDEMGSSCLAGWQPERSIVVEPFGAELAASIELGASCTSGDINTLLSQIESMGLQG